MQVILYRTDEKGHTRYYTLDDRQHSLFSAFTLTVSWGTSPEGSCRRHYTFASQKEKDARIRTLLRQKLKTHKVLYSFFKNSATDLQARQEFKLLQFRSS